MTDLSVRPKRRVPLSRGLPSANMMSAQTVVSMAHIIIGIVFLLGSLVRVVLAFGGIPFTLRSAAVIGFLIGFPAALLVSGNWMREGRARGATVAIIVHVIGILSALFTRTWPIESIALLLGVLWIQPALREPG